MPVLGNLQIEDAPIQTASTLEIPAATIGAVTTQTIESDSAAYFLVVPFHYSMNGEQRNFPGKIYLRNEWFSPEYKSLVNSGAVDTKAAQSYNISMSKLRTLFTAAGLSSGEFNTDELAGRTVGFRAVPDKKNPRYRTLQAVFPARN